MTDLILDCPPMKIGRSAIATTRDHYFGTKVSFTCPTGQEFRNGKNQISSECDIGGTWSVSVIPDCQGKRLPAIQMIQHRKVINASHLTFQFYPFVSALLWPSSPN